MRFSIRNLLRLAEADPAIKSKNDISSYDTWKRMSFPPGWRASMKWRGTDSGYPEIEMTKVDTQRAGRAKLTAELGGQHGSSRTTAGLYVRIEYAASEAPRSGYPNARLGHGAADEITVAAAKKVDGTDGWKVSSHGWFEFRAEKTFEIPRGVTALDVQKVVYQMDKEYPKVLDAIQKEILDYADEEHAEENALELLATTTMSTKKDMEDQLKYVSGAVKDALSALATLPDDPKEFVKQAMQKGGAPEQFVHAMKFVNYASSGWDKANEYSKVIQKQVTDLTQKLKAGFR